MRAFAFVSAISLLLTGSLEAAPRRVASLNLCTDELLLMLAEPRQIASVTYLSHLEAESLLWRQARRFRKNDGSLVSVVGLKPDLVLTMGGGGRDRMRIAARLGIRTLDLPFPETLADVEWSIVQVADAIGRRPAAAPLLARIAALKRNAPPRRIDTIWLGGGGRTLGASSLGGQWMALAGLRQRPLKGDEVSLEQLLVRPPTIILRSDYRSGQHSGEQRWLSHPLASANRRARTVLTDGRLWTCKGPSLTAEIERLRREVVR
ncbi:MAG TPA: ABC transporter substrate-binding protein [Allosphingosinicella sp.]|jgi:iron complex transport system substrate-binding protein